MLPSGMLFMDRDEVYQNKFARHRARWLCTQVMADVVKAPELARSQEERDRAKEDAETARPFRTRRQRKKDKEKPAASPDEVPEADAPADEFLDEWHIIAEVAEEYPRLLVWLTEGQVTENGFRNVFGPTVALLRRCPGLRMLLWLSMFKRVAERAPWRPSLYEAVLQHEREAKNKDEEGRRFELWIEASGSGSPGLSAVTNVAVLCATQARTELRDKVVHMASGAIGISGLRGSGKTSLIHDFCAHRYGTPVNLPEGPDHDDVQLKALRGLRLLVGAPLRFDARDFLVYLYSCLCRAVLTDVRFNTASPGRAIGPILLPRTLRPTVVIGSLSGIGFLALAAGLAFRAVYGHWPVPRFNDTQAWEWTAVAACLLAALVSVGWRVRHTMIEVRQVVNLCADAEERLRRLHYQRTDSRNAGGSLTGPLGTGLSVGTGQSFTEQVMSLPELIDDYRDFVSRVVAAMLADAQSKADAESKAEMPEVRLIIGIDEMDQIDDPTAAGMFLDELSAVFGTPNCVYLLALAPGTLAAVDQRTVPLKTSSSGMFDEMVWIEELTLQEAADLLDGRVVKMPAAFIALCYVLSGGLPRDLLRVARAVIAVAEREADKADKARRAGPARAAGAHQPATMTLTDAAEQIIRQEVRALRHRTLASAASLGISAAELGIGATSGWLEEFIRGPWTRPAPKAEWVQEVLSGVVTAWDAVPLRDDDPQAAVAAEVCNSFTAGLFFLLTVLELFTCDGGGTVNKLIAPDAAGATASSQGSGAWLNDNVGVLRDLVRARTALSVSPQVAATHVSKARACKGNRLGDEEETYVLAKVTLELLHVPPKPADAAARALAGGAAIHAGVRVIPRPAQVQNDDADSRGAKVNGEG